MEDECLSLTWNNHGATYRQTLSVLREENLLTDVTLACDGQKFSAHKLVLVTCSDYFRSILGDVPCQHPIVYMRGVTAREMQALINFMYTGQTDVPQKEVPSLLSTAEALQIKGLGVFNPSSEEGKVNRSQREKCTGSKKRRVDSSSVFNGSIDESGRSDTTPSVSRENNLLGNLYSHHYALLSSPKRRKDDENVTPKAGEYGATSESVAATNEVSPRKENEDSGNRMTPTSAPSSVLDTFLHHRQSSNSKVASTSSTATSASPSPRDPPLPEEMSGNTVTSLSLDISRQRIPDKHSTQTSTSQQNMQNPTRPEAKAASPRALNYSIAGLGGNKLPYGAGALGHMSEESSTVLAETPENLMKAEIKEEALDFSSTTLSENHHGDTLNPSVGTNNIEEETRMYLDAFARSANISWQQTPGPGEPIIETAAIDGRPYVCPICQKSFAKAAILKRHHLAHFRPYVCHICTRSFTRREVLAEHLLEHNGADLRMPCPVCGMTIKRKRNLQAHIKVKHPDYYRQTVNNKKEAAC